MKLILVASIVFLLNIPFGYWRYGVKKFSIQWFLAIHLPVPLVILIRIYSDIGFEIITYPIIIAAFFLGQFVGGRIRRWSTKKIPASSTTSPKGLEKNQPE
jgi:hypothetical protein